MAFKERTEKLSREYYRVEFHILEKPTSKPLPLQFVNIWIPGVDELPMSISDYVEERQILTVIFRVVGEGTRRLRDQSGYFGIKGFLGKGFTPRGHDRILFIAGGVGIAPLPLLARFCLENNCSIDVIWGVKSGDMLFNLERITSGVREVHYATEDCSVGYCGTAVDVARNLVKSRKHMWSLVVSVGPKSMLRALCRELSDTGIDVYVSLEAMVKCGLGACGACVLKPLPRLLCIDGPVFNCREVTSHLEYTEN